MNDGSTRVVVLNKDPQQQIRLDIPASRTVKLWRLQAPDLTATSGVRLAGSVMEAGQPWKPRHEEHLPGTANKVRVTIPGASAAAIFL